jgi:superfamily II DNA or RNA helicase
MRMIPYRWQNTALARFVRAAFFALICDCGCGKTLAALLIARAKQLPVIIIAPRHRLCAQWAEAVRECAGPDEDIWVYDRNEERTGGEAYARRYREWLMRKEAAKTE